MGRFSIAEWVIGASGFLSLMICFIVLYAETKEPISSLTGAILGATLVMGSLIVLLWFMRVFKK